MIQILCTIPFHRSLRRAQFESDNIIRDYN